MYFPRGVLVGTSLLAACCILGCGEESKGMQNVQPGTGPDIQKNLPLKKGKKPMPPDPPSPKPPPR